MMCTKKTAMHDISAIG